jgi:hypothetical protein
MQKLSKNRFLFKLASTKKTSKNGSDFFCPLMITKAVSNDLLIALAINLNNKNALQQLKSYKTKPFSAEHQRVSIFVILARKKAY